MALLAVGTAGLSLGALVGLMVLAPIGVTMPFGPVPEELRWRGYALPRLLQGYRPIVASVILGFSWTLWYVPAFFVPGVAIPSAFAVTSLTIVLYLANNTALCRIITGLFLRGR